MAKKKLTKAQTLKKIKDVLEILFNLWEDKLAFKESFSKSLSARKVVEMTDYMISFRKRIR